MAVMMFLLCLLSLAVIGVPGYYDVLSENSTFFTLYNGDFDNFPQTADGFLPIQGRFIPVHVPALKGPAVYVEFVVNGSIKVLQLAEVVDVNKNKIRAKLYDFLDYTNLKPLTYDVKKLSQLQPAELRSYDDCFAFYEIKDRYSLTASYPACQIVNNDGEYPRFTGRADCRQFPVKFPLGVVEERLAVTYNLVHGPRRYPIPRKFISEGFVSPCKDSIEY